MSRLRRDLVERRLWIVLVALVVAVAAVPFVLHGHSDASADVIGPTVTGPSGVPAGAAGGSAEATSDRAAGHASVSAAVRHAETTRDPFAAATSASSTKTTAARATSTTATTAPRATPTTATTATTAETNARPSIPAASANPATPSAATHSDPKPATRVVTRTVTVTTTTPAATSTGTTAKTTASTKPSSAGHGAWTVYAVSAVVSATGHAAWRADLARLTPLPSVRSPKVMFTGVLGQGRGAVFALGDGVRATGPDRCRPSRADCAAIVLASGQVERLSWSAPGGATVAEYLADRITPKKVDSAAAERTAFARVSRAGRCELDLADPLAYDQRRGTVSETATIACRGIRHAVAFPGPHAGS